MNYTSAQDENWVDYRFSEKERQQTRHKSVVTLSMCTNLFGPELTKQWKLMCDVLAGRTMQNVRR